MHVLTAAAGKRTEHWISLFDVLTDRTDVQITVHASELCALTGLAPQWLDTHCGRFRLRLAPHPPGEGRTGHEASAQPVCGPVTHSAKTAAGILSKGGPSGDLT
ncbi:hypothetical protein [Streptomyces sp. TRM49041]|uniref:hypothetical protein n=1 Tax=Streptomyces sp. TRM49041 TaxID=2603216 RepID=UPI0016568A2A|nr:hypothetical protein [Streptomyces sp. TRM49041]